MEGRDSRAAEEGMVVGRGKVKSGGGFVGTLGKGSVVVWGDEGRIRGFLW